MIKRLYLLNLKENRIPIIAILGILLMYSSIALIMFNPDNLTAMDAFMKMMPEEFLSAFGFDDFGTTLISYLSTFLYGFIMLMFPLIFIIISGNKLVASYVDSGSMTYLVTMPYTRKKIIVTQAVSLISYLLFIYLIPIAMLFILSHSMFPESLNSSQFILLNFVTISVQLLMSSIMFFASCYFNDSGRAMGVGGGIVFMFYILKMLMGISDELDFIKYLTPYSLVNVSFIADHSNTAVLSGVLCFIITVVIYCISILTFNKKNLII